MASESSKGLHTLWASSGTDAALSCAPAIQKWLLPASRILEVLTVAPLGAGTRRMTRWTGQQRENDLREAMTAAERSVAALGDTNVPIETRTRWGAADREIAAYAEESMTDVLVMGAGNAESLRKAILGSTAQHVVFNTTRSVLLARTTPDERPRPLVIMYSPHGVFTNALSMFERLRVPPEVPVYLVALLDPVKPFGSMFLTLNEAIRSREQASHDVQADLLRRHLEETAGRMSEEAGRSIEIVVRDCDARDIPSALDKMRPALVVVGDRALADSLSEERRTVANIARRVSCSVLVAR